MIRLILSDLLFNLRIWFGVLLLSMATAAVGTVAAAEIETGVRTGGTVGLALYALSGIVVLFSALTAVVVLGSVVDLAIVLQRRSYALWQLIGIGPGRIRLVIHAQLALIALVGTAVGCAAMAPALPPLFRFFLAETTGLRHVRPSFGPVAALAVAAFVLMVTTLGGIRGSRQAGRVPPLQWLRSVDAPPRRMAPGRLVGAVTLVIVLLLIILTVPGTDPNRVSVPLMLIAPLVAGVIATVGPLLYPAFIRRWTELVPASASAAWYLARNSVVHNVTRSSAAISPLMIAVALTGGFFTATTIGAAATHPTGPGASGVTVGSLALLLGGPVLLAMLGSTATIFISGRSRQREFALIQAAGSTPTAVVTAAALEAGIYALTAGALGAAAVAATTLVGLSAAPHMAFAAGPVSAIAAVGLLLILAATVLPTRAALRARISEVLAVE